MDSLTQIALGSAVSVAVMGRRTAAWKAALWGAVCGTLPDLDALIDHGDAVRNMTLHRAESHALFYLTLISPVVAALAVAAHRDRTQWRRWWLAVWLALVTPTAFNTVLWRIVAVTPQGYAEGFRSLFDQGPDVHFDLFPRGEGLRAQLRGHWPVERMDWFAHGFIKMEERDGRVLLSDLRMGQEPYYTFTFPVAERRGSGLAPLARPGLAGQRPDVERALPWLWRRLQGEPLPPPR
ncbi:MAG TPA: metal-dependent hydrolase [Burkholderiaceae bacterium]|nr:metal-dependent hydrolase [Burkholderiaceae bacterium]